MNANVKARFDILYTQHLRAPKLRGKASPLLSIRVQLGRRVVKQFHLPGRATFIAVSPVTTTGSAMTHPPAW